MFNLHCYWFFKRMPTNSLYTEFIILSGVLYWLTLSVDFVIATVSFSIFWCFTRLCFFCKFSVMFTICILLLIPVMNDGKLVVSLWIRIRFYIQWQFTNLATPKEMVEHLQYTHLSYSFKAPKYFSLGLTWYDACLKNILCIYIYIKLDLHGCVSFKFYIQLL